LSCSNKIDEDAEKSMLLETDRKFAKMSMESGTAIAFKSYLTKDAMQFNPGMPILKSRNSIYEYLRRGLDSTSVISWEPLGSEVSQSGDLGFTWGRYTFSKIDVETNKQKELSQGKYVNIWEKQIDGSWKVKIDIGNSTSKTQNAVDSQ